MCWTVDIDLNQKMYQNSGLNIFNLRHAFPISAYLFQESEQRPDVSGFTFPSPFERRQNCSVDKTTKIENAESGAPSGGITV